MIDAKDFDERQLEETLTKHMCQPRPKTLIGIMIDMVAAVGMAALMLFIFFLAIAALR